MASSRICAPVLRLDAGALSFRGLKYLCHYWLVGFALIGACADHDLASPGAMAFEDAAVDAMPSTDAISTVMVDAPLLMPDAWPIADAGAEGDGLMSDGGADAAVAAKRIFVSSLVFTGKLGGTVGADAKCQMLATTARLQGDWKAWLSTRSAAVRNRSTQTAVPYVRVDGVRVANNWADLVDGNLQNPILLNEIGAAEEGDAWTGTLFDGSSSPASDCSGYTSDDVGTGHCGTLFATNAGWTDVFRPNCVLPLHLYCLEQ
jgi:Protein of unknown function (DUF1554)